MAKILIKDIEEISKHNPHAEIKDKIKEYLDNNIDKWIESLELFNEYGVGRYFEYVKIPFTINHDDFNALSFDEKVDIISEIIYIDPTYIIDLEEGKNNQLIISLNNQSVIYLFCKTFGYMDKLMEVIAEDINSKILTHSPHKNYTSTIFDIRYAYVNSFIEHIKKIFPDCYTLNFTTDSYSIHLGITWGSSFLK